MTTIRVETDKLEQVCLHLERSVSMLQGGSADLFRAAYGAPSYDGQYGPWLWGLAEDASASLHILADQLTELAEWLSRVTAAFIEADQLQASGNVAWAVLVYELVERGQPPATVDSLYAWMASDVRPPWIDEATWRAMDPALRSETVESARLAYEEQLARIERLRTPPWEKDESWLWRVAGISPAVLSAGHYFTDEELSQYRQHVENLRVEYEAKWEDFLQSQSIYKFGVGDDLTEAFSIYLFGLDGAAEHGVGLVAASRQRLLGNPRFDFTGGVAAQYLALEGPDGIPQFFGRGYGSARAGDFGIHYNLCGQLATGVTIGADPVDALVAFEQISGGPEILDDHTMGTRSQDLIELLEEYGWEGERVGNSGDPYPWRDPAIGELTWHPEAHQVASHLDEGRAVIALVSLDSSSGYVSETGTVPHWISVLQIVEPEQGGAVARIYNPFENREEWIKYDDLVDAWTPGPNYRAVVATPPGDMAWLPSP